MAVGWYILVDTTNTRLSGARRGKDSVLLDAGRVLSFGNDAPGLLGTELHTCLIRDGTFVHDIAALAVLDVEQPVPGVLKGPLLRDRPIERGAERDPMGLRSE